MTTEPLKSRYKAVAQQGRHRAVGTAVPAAGIDWGARGALGATPPARAPTQRGALPTGLALGSGAKQGAG